jgi:dTDP-4-dehydrorhamnose 3,5-epimerase
MADTSDRFGARTGGLAGYWLLERRPHGDRRGWFERLYCGQELQAWGHPGVLAQVNRSCTRTAGTIRGLHGQRPPWAEWKVVTCLRGAAMDVVADLRPDSATYLQHRMVRLVADEPCSVLVPPGCVHGFQSLEAECEMLYLHSHPYAPAAEFGLRWDDPALAIDWPLPCASVSDRDTALPYLTAGASGATG